MDEIKTSRHRVLDAVELIWQLQALNSHYEEYVNSMILNESTEDAVNFATQQIKMNDNMRRDIMNMIAGSGKQHRWCTTKHAIFAYTLWCELNSANPDFEQIKKWLSKQMYSSLSLFLWEDIETCGRCLNDSLLSK